VCAAEAEELCHVQEAWRPVYTHVPAACMCSHGKVEKTPPMRAAAMRARQLFAVAASACVYAWRRVCRYESVARKAGEDATAARAAAHRVVG